MRLLPSLLISPHSSPKQRRARNFYVSAPFQNLVAVLISVNFIINAAQSELQPEIGSNLDRIFGYIDMAFTIVFAVELGINLIAHWFWPFWTGAH
jgi:hypothetical protein